MLKKKSQGRRKRKAKEEEEEENRSSRRKLCTKRKTERTESSKGIHTIYFFCVLCNFRFSVYIFSWVYRLHILLGCAFWFGFGLCICFGSFFFLHITSNILMYISTYKNQNKPHKPKCIFSGFFLLLQIDLFRRKVKLEFETKTNSISPTNIPYLLLCFFFSPKKRRKNVKVQNSIWYQPALSLMALFSDFHVFARNMTRPDSESLFDSLDDFLDVPNGNIETTHGRTIFFPWRCNSSLF